MPFHFETIKQRANKKQVEDFKGDADITEVKIGI